MPCIFSTITFLAAIPISPLISILTAGGYLEKADVNQEGGANFLNISPRIAILSG